MRNSPATWKTRITELEAKLAIELKSLEQQDRSVATAIRAHVEDLNSHFNDQVAALRRHADEDRQAVCREMIALHSEFAEEAANAIELPSAEAVNRHIAVFRAELEYKDDQIAELREVIFGFAQACRTLTERPAPRMRPESEPDPSNLQVLPERRAG